jgi:AraC-like DNA-binding protein
MLCRVIRGGVEKHVDRHEPAVFGPGDVGALGIADGSPLAGRVHPSRYNHLILEPELLSRCATGAPGEGPVRLQGSAPVSPAANRHLGDLIEYVRRSAANPMLGQHPLLVASIEAHVAATLLAVLPTTALLDLTPADRRDATPVLLRRAIAFIDDNAHTDIALADIANAIYVTPRALQYMFRRHRDCTPMEYVRRVRLHHAHRELLAGDRMSTTVGDIARRWGFGNMGRFAVHYRQMYGQSPHTTLRT